MSDVEQLEAHESQGKAGSTPDAACPAGARLHPGLELLRTVAEHSSDVLYFRRLLPRPAYEYVSSSCLAATGYTPEEYYADPDLGQQLVFPEDRAAFVGGREVVEGPTTAVVRYRHRAGHQVWLEIVWHPICDASGRVYAKAGIARDVTARIQAEEERRRLSESWRALYETSPAAIIISDRTSWRIMAANDAAVKLYGFSREEFLTLTVLDVRPPEEHARAQVVLDHSDEHTGDVGRWLHRRKDGTKLWVNIYSENIVFEGRPARLSTVVDVTRQVEIEQQLRASEARLKALLGCTNGIVFEFDETGRILSLWTDDEALLIAPREQVIGRPFTEFLGDEGAEYLQVVRRVLQTGVSESLEYRLKVMRGDRWFLGELLPAPAVPGAPPTVALLVRDITRRKQAQEALQHSEANFRTLLDTLPDGVVIHRDGLILYCNDALCLSNGYSKEELTGQPIRSFVPADEYERVRQRSEEALRSPQRLPVRELRLLRRDGAVITTESSSIRVTFEGAPAVLAVLHDVTEQRRLQERLMLADRMVSVGTLAAGVAHEINNPLSFVLANVEWAQASFERLCQRAEGEDRQAPECQEIRDALHDAEDGSRRVRQLVKELKTFSRVDEERRDFVDVQRVLESSLNMASNQIRHRARLTKAFEKTPPIVANEARLGQVFLNLLINAAQAIREGDAEHNRIHVALSPRPGGGVIVAISDTGSGIPREILPRIFDPFFTTKPVGVGTGLGLSICQSTVLALGGEIRVESVEGKGTTFTVELPRGALAPVVAEAPRSAAQPRRSRLLIIDDDEPVGLVLKRVLKAQHEVAFFSNARDALAILSGGERFDLILCDLMMPDLTGIDVYHELMLLDPSQASRMVFMTGGAFTPEAEAFFEEPGRWRLEKPFDSEGLQRVLAEALQALAGLPSTPAT